MLSRLVFALLLLSFVICKPTLYKKNANDNLEPVLVAVSSTVIPLSVYKASDHPLAPPHSRYNKNSKPSAPIKLITVKNKKVMDEAADLSSEQGNIKQLSKDQFDLKPQ